MIAVLAFGAMATRLIVLQIFEAPGYVALAADQRQREVIFPARRGAIFDRGGEPLAISVDLQTVFADPAHVEDPATEALELAPLLKEPVAEVESALTGTFEGDRFEYLARQVEPKLAERIEALKLPGVFMEEEPKRYYPGGRLAAHLLGFVDVDGKGLEGVESEYEEILQGQPGKMILEQDPEGRSLPQAEYSYESPDPGRSLFLTIDKQLQYFTQLTLAAAVGRYSADAGTAIVMRPGTGEILALANVPTFNPNEPGDHSSDERRNRAVTDVYEPGSAFKIVTAAAALEERVVTPHTTFGVPDSFAYSDRVFHDSHPHPPETMSVAEIIEQSSNVGTIQIGLRLGGKQLDRYVRRFGFGQRTGLDFPGESEGIVLDRKDWTGPTIAAIPIGQGIAVTPLQMAAAYSTLANDGMWVEPKLVSGTMNGNGRVDPATAPATKRVVSKRTARSMTKILERVAEQGTGVEGQVPGYAVAGKTGTAQKPLPGGGYGNSYTASFAGYAPASRPAVVVIVVLDEPSPIWGGSTAAPTFKLITEFALRHLGIAPTGNAARAAEQIEADSGSEASTHD